MDIESIEVLKSELRKLGYTQGQVESATVPAVAAYLAKNTELLTAIANEHKESVLPQTIEALERNVAKLKSESNKLRGEVDRIKEERSIIDSLPALRSEYDSLSQKTFKLRQDDSYIAQIRDLHAEYLKLRAGVQYEGKRRDYYQAATKTLAECDEKINSFNASLINGETPAGRDTLRAAQLFINAVDIDTDEDNTAFIAGLAAILCKGTSATLDALQKINTDITDAVRNKYDNLDDDQDDERDDYF